MTEKQCPNPLCGSTDLALVNLTGDTALVCRDCGQTVREDVYGMQAGERGETPLWEAGPTSALGSQLGHRWPTETADNYEFLGYECEHCGLIGVAEVYESENLPLDYEGTLLRCQQCTNAVRPKFKLHTHLEEKP